MIILLLFFLFELKHFICDGLLQTVYHLGKFNDKFKDYWKPLLNHAWINGIGASMIAISFSNGHKIAWMIFGLEIVLHFVIDRLKASKKLLGRWKTDQAMFWHALMFDQMLHRFCYILYIALILRLI